MNINLIKYSLANSGSSLFNNEMIDTDICTQTYHTLTSSQRDMLEDFDINEKVTPERVPVDKTEVFLSPVC